MKKLQSDVFFLNKGYLFSRNSSKNKFSGIPGILRHQLSL